MNRSDKKNEGEIYSAWLRWDNSVSVADQSNFSEKTMSKKTNEVLLRDLVLNLWDR